MKSPRVIRWFATVVFGLCGLTSQNSGLTAEFRVASAADGSINRDKDLIVLPSGRVATRIGGTEFYGSLDVVEEFLPAEPGSLLDPQLADGPGVGPPRAVQIKVGCNATLVAADGWDYALADEMHVFEPGGDPIASSTNSVFKPAITGDVVATVTDPPEGTYQCTVDWYVEGQYLGRQAVQINVNYVCPGDLEKSSIRQEYRDKNVAASRWVTCEDLANNHQSTYFYPSELNKCTQGHHKHDLFAALPALLDGLDAVRSEHGQAITTTVAYRCPIHNQQAGSQYTTTSWHMAGRAADLWPVSPDQPASEWQTLMQYYAASHGAQTALYPGGMVHVEWEG